MPAARVLVIAPPGPCALTVARWINSRLPPLDSTAEGFVRELYERVGLGYRGTPFRAPHHTASLEAMCGSRGRVCEAQLARHGLLALLDLAEFRGSVLEELDRALEDVPCVVVATALPCPCGWYRGDYRPDAHLSPRPCSCRQGWRDRYRERWASRPFGRGSPDVVVDESPSMDHDLKRLATRLGLVCPEPSVLGLHLSDRWADARAELAEIERVL